MDHPSGNARTRFVPGAVLVLAAAPLLVLASCVDGSDTADRAREAELVARSLAVAIETADSALIRDLFWPQATYEDFPNQHSYLGVEEIVGYMTGAHRWADDVLMNVGAVHPTAHDGVIFEWVFSGVQSRPLPGVLSQGTGHEVVLNGVTIVEMDGGRVVRAADYTDSGALLLQLGARVELPDGTSLQLR